MEEGGNNKKSVFSRRNFLKASSVTLSSGFELPYLLVGESWFRPY